MIVEQNLKNTNLNVVALQCCPYPLSLLLLSLTDTVLLMVLIHVGIGAIELHICIPALHLSSKPIPLPAQGPRIPHWPLELSVLGADLNRVPLKCLILCSLKRLY